jgi:hypothetical protein
MKDNFIANGLLSKKVVFEGTLVCDYNDPDIENLLNVHLYLFKVTRYWSGNFKTEYMIIAADAISTCRIGFNDETKPYVFSGQSVALNPRYAESGKIYYVTSCEVMESGMISALEWQQSGSGTMLNTVTKDIKEPCNEFAKLQKDLQEYDVGYERVYGNATEATITKGNYKVQVQGLIIVLIIVLMYPLILRIKKKPLGILLKSTAIAIAISLTVIMLLIAAQGYRNSRLSESLGVQDLIVIIVSLGFVNLLLSLPAIFTLKPSVQRNKYLAFAMYLTLPTLFLLFYLRVSIPITLHNTADVAALVTVFTYVLVLAVFVSKEK